MTRTGTTTTPGVVGTRVPRLEDARLVTGKGTFVDDVTRPGMAHACFVRSPLPRAAIGDIDVSAALELDGVLAVYTAADLNSGVHEISYALDIVGFPPVPRPPLAEQEVRFVGDPVALVVAVDRYVAEDAAELVIIDYEPLEPVVDYVTAADSPNLVHAGFAGNSAGEMAGRPAADLAPLFDSAAHVVRQRIFQQAYLPVPLETRGIVADWSAPTAEMTIWSSTQSPHEMRGFCARLLGIDEHRVRVIARDTGGGFGLKQVPLREDACVLLAARKLGTAVKWIEDRQENLMAAGMSRHEHADVRMAFDAEGKILAAAIDHVQNVGAYPTPSPLTGGVVVGLLFPGPYRISDASFTAKFLYSNTVGRLAYRGPWQFESVTREILLDHAARRIGIDPIELRRRNMLRRDELPWANPNGMTYDNISPLETLEQAVEMLDYEAFRERQREARAEGRYLGVGTCTYVEPTTGGSPFLSTEGATIRIEPSGKVNVYVAGGSAGNSLETTVVQLTADALGTDLADVRTIQGDTAITPFGGGTGGSRSGSMTAGAIAETASVLRERILAIAAHRLGVSPADIEFVRSRATVRAAPDEGLTLAEIAEIAYYQTDSLPPGVPPGLEASERYKTPQLAIWANATHVCTCEVDIDTGAVRLLRYIVSEDCGPMINPNVVEGQIYGGTVQGIGGALYEHLAYDESGNPVATTFLDYLLPTAAETPTIEVGHIETPSPGPGDFKGVGEGGAIGATPAVLNAVADALAPFGVEISKLPLSPATIVAMLDEARAAGKGSA
ncbi:xanthine dehydrogenase family protein molybdopterin-binding subunit [Nocardia sp. CDC186]|uniref:Xanthine dehydrogenase family protein molybdopterin-binding subunit n=1 Tax=Nocardia implantans TaxID=3108168 RepID=A0ABU6AS49_9NOCA|nr:MULTISPECIES: xanthine dehydrogenase family protein molybdopterin-binding subunit [unclassified Nocardia]MBF6191621.1 xanthine dehydrogenase family protein [Nocardia beijingensis]MEA3528072.1 xanthine dehydrogenase family protein molybdopterin-binding subunit [Nocardia sp. CDC192]MEB3510176.1 xanthine dehydrogenase family protein molybdopterin-binding subunit [Nocardia sp. CDC186]